MKHILFRNKKGKKKMERKKVINEIEIIRMRTPEEKIDYLIIQFALLKVTLEGKIYKNK